MALFITKYDWPAVIKCYDFEQNHPGSSLPKGISRVRVKALLGRLIRDGGTTSAPAEHANDGIPPDFFHVFLLIKRLEIRWIFLGVKAICVAGQRDNLNPIKEFVRCIVTDDDGGPLLPNLPAD